MVIRVVLPTLRSLGVSGVCVTTHASSRKRKQEKLKQRTHCDDALQVREMVSRDGQANESRASTAIHSVSVWQHADGPSCHGMTAHLHPLSPLVITLSTHLVRSVECSLANTANLMRLIRI
jgi:hypothetical protein